MTIKWKQLVLVCAVALVSATCGSIESPTSPTPPVAATPPPAEPPPPPPPPPPAPVFVGKVEATVTPNPVPFSGQPITDAPSCANSKNTWFYTQVLRETGGAEVTLRGRVDKFDGSTVNNRTDLNLVVPANGTINVASRWCSVTAAEHTAQTTFTGTDASGNAVTVTGPVVTLMKP